MEERQDLAMVALRQAKEDARWHRRGRDPNPRRQRRSDPVVLQTAFSELVAERMWVIPTLPPWLTSWPDIVGPEIAAHVTAVDVDGRGRFIVRADSKAWAAQMRLLAPQLVPRINREHTAVRTLRVLSPQDPRLPVENVPLQLRAGLVSGVPAPADSDSAPQPGDDEPATPFYAPQLPSDVSSTAQAVRRLALARARAAKRP